MGTFIFIGHPGATEQDGGSIAGFKANADGSLTPVPGSPFKTNYGPSVVRSDPQDRFLFIGENSIAPRAGNASCSGQPSILSVERVDSISGALMQVGSITLRGACVRDIVIDPSGKHLYVGVENITTTGGAIQEFLIGATGTLTEINGSPVMVENLPVNFAMHPNGRVVYAATPNLTVLDRDPATGALTVRSVFSTPKRQLTLNPAGTLLVARERDSKEISEFQVDAGGNVIGESRLQTLPLFARTTDPLVAVVQTH